MIKTIGAIDMSQDIIYGKFAYKDKEYPFFLSNHIITVTQSPREFNDDFIGESHFDHLVGVTHNGRYITFLDCDVIGEDFIAICNNLLLVCKGYVLTTEPTEHYTGLVFSSPALNAFYSPRHAIGFVKKDPFGISGLQLRDYADTTRRFSCIINNQRIDFKLSCYSTFNTKPESSNIGSIRTTLSMTFPCPQSIDDLGKYYLYLFDFLMFTNFRSDIPVDDMELCQVQENEQHRKVGKIKIFQHDDSQYSADIKHSITYEDIPEGCVPTVFSTIAQRRNRNCFNPYFFPTDDRDANRVDSAKWLIAAISFEGEFDKVFHNHRYQTNERFMRTKDLLMDTIDKAVLKSGVSINNKTNESLKYFKHLISKADETIEEKFTLCLEHYSFAVNPIIQKYTSIYPSIKGINLAKAYSIYRNNTAHGIIMPVSPAEVVTYQILRCFIYSLILEQCHVSTEKIQAIILKLFH